MIRPPPVACLATNRLIDSSLAKIFWARAVSTSIAIIFGSSVRACLKTPLYIMRRTDMRLSFRRSHIVDQINLVAVQKEKMHQCHQTPGAISFHRILVFDGEIFSSIAVLVDSERNLRDLVVGFVKDIEHHMLGSGPSLLKLDAQLTFVQETLLAPMLRPYAQPPFQHAGRHLDRLTMLHFSGFSTHGRCGE